MRGKGNRHDRLPLPADVGEAIAGLPAAGSARHGRGREVFVRVAGPASGADRGRGRPRWWPRAARRAGLGTIYAHRLRHTAATAMLRAGRVAGRDRAGAAAPHALTTAIYAKVDRERLRALARPWPGEAA